MQYSRNKYIKEDEKLEIKDKEFIERKVKEIKRLYNRQYYQKNKQRIHENQKRYWERKALEVLKEE